VHPKWLRFRHMLFRYRQVEQRIARRPGVRRLLDIGCGDGENMLRFRHLPLRMAGLEVSAPRLQAARQYGLDVLQARGESLPFSAGSWDMIYIAHVLHHVAHHGQVLGEIDRCLAADGSVFVIETVEDNPLLRLGRRIQPSWRGDALEVAWRFDDLVKELEHGGFEVEESGRYNIVFFLWEMAPLRFWPLEVLTPIFVYLDLILARFFPDAAAHCYFVLRRRRVDDGEA